MAIISRPDTGEILAMANVSAEARPDGALGAAEPSSNKGFHSGIERHGEEGGDEHPRDCVQREVYEHQPEDRGRGDRHPDEH